MKENKYICPKCGAEMIAVYEKPALNLTCPKCGCKIATTKWEDIDLDDTDYEIVLKLSANPSMNQVKFLSNILRILQAFDVNSFFCFKLIISNSFSFASFMSP